jgi:hypothetical protein
MHNTTYLDILHFYGILMMMVLFPLPGTPYTAYWMYASPMFIWTNMKTLHWFNQLQIVLHFNSNLAEVKGKDALNSTWMLFNMLKKTIGVFRIPGSELSLDEASCTSPSIYGRELIFFNPAKNYGKFHFDFYLLCDALTSYCLVIEVATRHDSDPTDPEETLESIQQEANYSLLNKLVLEMCHKYNNTFIPVNMDNYYTSPLVLILLRKCGIYTRENVKKPKNGTFTNCAHEGRNQMIA